jgi:predicted secreted Zn-dependent protease
MIKSRLILPLCAVLAVCAFAPSAALAQVSSSDAYSGVAGKVQTDVQPQASKASPVSPTPPATQAKTSSSLPFTGLDLTFVLGAGALLVGMGFGLRRLSVRRAPVA